MQLDADHHRDMPDIGHPLIGRDSSSNVSGLEVSENELAINHRMYYRTAQPWGIATSFRCVTGYLPQEVIYPRGRMPPEIDARCQANGIEVKESDRANNWAWAGPVKAQP